MPNKIVFTLLVSVASALCPRNVQSAAFADSVINYSPGTGFSAGFTTPGSALGEPSRVTPGQFGGPVDPFSPPYLSEQLVSIGEGGSLTVGFSSPVWNDPGNPFGLDLIIFGNSGFQIINGDFTGGGITDGSLFGANTGATRVSISADGNTFYELTPSLAPVVDGPFPTDGTGNFFLPLSPALNSASFAGKGLAGFRELYNGSAGGTAFDISWARTPAGEPANLSSIQYVRINVLSGASEIDGISAVPEPRIVAVLLGGLGALFLSRRKL